MFDSTSIIIILVHVPGKAVVTDDSASYLANSGAVGDYIMSSFFEYAYRSIEYGNECLSDTAVQFMFRQVFA